MVGIRDDRRSNLHSVKSLGGRQGKAHGQAAKRKNDQVLHCNSNEISHTLELQSSLKRPAIYNQEIKKRQKSTDKDRIRKKAKDALTGVVLTNSAHCAVRLVNQDYRPYAAAQNRYHLLDSTIAPLEVPQRGFGLIKASRSMTATVCMLEHALWCQGKGDKEISPNGSKIFPLEMERSMIIRGTAIVIGELAYPNDPWMTVSATGFRAFSHSPTVRIGKNVLSTFTQREDDYYFSRLCFL